MPPLNIKTYSLMPVDLSAIWAAERFRGSADGVACRTQQFYAELSAHVISKPSSRAGF